MRTYLILIFLFLSVCVHKVEATPDFLSKIHTIGVISVLGNNLNYQRVGTTIFTNKVTSNDISNWRLDDYITYNVKKNLNPDYNIITAPDQYDLNPEHTKESHISGGGLLGALMNPNVNNNTKLPKDNNVELIRKFIADFGGDPGKIDAWLVIRPTCQGDVITQSNQSICGIGVYRHFGLLTEPRVWVHVIAHIFILDPKTLSPIGGEDLSVAIPDWPYFNPPLQNLGTWENAEDFTTLGEAKQQEIHTAIQDLIQAGLNYTLADLKLKSR